MPLIIRMTPGLSRGHDGGQAFWGNQPVARCHQLSHFVPVNGAQVQAERHPSPWSDIRGHIEPVGLGGDQRLVIAGQHPGGYCNDAVSVMVIQVVSEGLLPDQEADVMSSKLLSNLGEREADLGEPHEAPVFSWVLGGARLLFHSSKKELARSQTPTCQTLSHPRWCGPDHFNVMLS